MSGMDEEVVEVQFDAPPELLERLRAALETEEEYPKEADLMAYVVLLGFHLEEVKRLRNIREERNASSEEVYRAAYADLARVQAAYARTRHSFAEAAQGYETGRMTNVALGREVAATKTMLVPRLESQRDRLRERRKALKEALEEAR